MQAAEQAKTIAMAQGQQADNLAWANKVDSMQNDIDLYTYINGRVLATNERIGNEVQDLKDKSSMYVDLLTRDNAQNLRLCDELYKRTRRSRKS